jgi:hypothetical protein
MKNKKQVIPTISNEEHFAGVKNTYETEVLPFLEENRKAWQEYKQGKKPLNLTSTQKATLQCQNPI